MIQRMRSAVIILNALDMNHVDHHQQFMPKAKKMVSLNVRQVMLAPLQEI